MSWLLGVAAAVAVVLPAGAGAAPGGTGTLSLVAVTERSVDVPAGRIAVQVDEAAGGRVIGADAVNCRAAKRSAARAIGVSLRGGTPYLATVERNSGISGRLVAGTGVHAGDAGTVVAKPLSLSKTEVAVRLRPAPSARAPTRPMHPLRFVATLRWVYVPGGFVMTDFDSNPGGGLVGTDTVNSRAHTAHGCYATVDLPADTLYISLLLGHSGDTESVVAGTGGFAGAHGHVVVRDITSTRSMVTVEFCRS